MTNILIELKKELMENSKECERAAVRRAKIKEYNDSVELIHFSSCYKSAARIVEKYLNRFSVAAEAEPQSGV